MKNKIKTRKSFLKRIKKTAYGFVRKKANKGHLLRKKTSKRKRSLNSITKLNLTQAKLIKKFIKN